MPVPIGIATVTGVGLAQNPSYTHTWRDASSARAEVTQHKDIFNPSENPQPPPWVAEHRIQLQSPHKYTSRVKNMVLVHTGGSTGMAFETHHTVCGTPNLTGTLYRGLQQDNAYTEEVVVSQEVLEQMPEVIKACQQYHLHCNDGWITSTGFVVCAHKAGLHLTRDQFLALERAVPKDTMGRINYYHVAEAVQRLASGEGPFSMRDTPVHFSSTGRVW